MEKPAKKKIIIFLIIVIIVIFGYFILTTISKPKLGFGPCRIWNPVYTSNYEATSDEDAKKMMIDFFDSKNLDFNQDDIKVERIKKYYLFTDYYKITYHICGTINDIENIPTGHAASISGGTPSCSNIPFKVKNKQIIGQFINPC